VRKVPDEERAEGMKERLQDLGYVNGGHVYEFFAPASDLDELLADIREEAGLNFTEGDDGHATLSRDTLRITSREELSETELKGIEEAVK